MSAGRCAFKANFAAAILQDPPQPSPPVSIEPNGKRSRVCTGPVLPKRRAFSPPWMVRSSTR